MPGFLKSAWVVAVLVSAPALALIFPIFPKTEDPRREPANVSDPREQEQEAARLRYAPVSGYLYTYGFERKISFHGLNGGIPELAYHGRFYLEVVSADAEGFDAIVGASIAEHPVKKAPSLLIHADRKGESITIRSKGLEGDEEKQYADVIKDLMSLWLFPSRSDTVGTFLAEISALPSEKGVFRKKKKAYLAPHMPEVTNSLHLLRWNASMSLPESVEGKESTRMGEGKFSLSADSSYKLVYESAAKAKAKSRAKLAEWKEAETLALKAGDKSESPEYTKISWTKVAAELRGIDRLSNSEQLRVFGDLIRVLEKHPEKLPEILALLSRDTVKAGASSQLFKTIVGALATVASDAAQAALVEIFRDPDCPVSGKGAVLTALTTTQARLNGDTQDFLAAAMRESKEQDLAYGAAFALGAALQNAPDSSHTRDAVQAIHDAYAKESGHLAAELALLDAMGNSGRAEFLPELTTTIDQSQNRLLRAKAEFALRFMTAPEAVSRMVSGLSDKDESVRVAAAEAIRLAPWKETYRAPLKSCADSDPSERVRSSCREVYEQALQQLADAG